jgi:hypothetical protein
VKDILDEVCPCNTSYEIWSGSTDRKSKRWEIIYSNHLSILLPKGNVSHMYWIWYHKISVTFLIIIGLMNK